MQKVSKKSTRPLRIDAGKVNTKKENPSVVQNAESDFVLNFVDHEWNKEFYVPTKNFGPGLTFASIIHKQYKSRWNAELVLKFHKRVISEYGTAYLATLVDHESFTKSIENLAKPIMIKYPDLILYHKVGEDGKLFLKIDENVKHDEFMLEKIETMETNPEDEEGLEMFDFVAYSRVSFYVNNDQKTLGYFFKTRSVRLL